MARRAGFSALARAWFKAEIAYIAARNPAAARKIAARFETARRTLAEYPRAGRTGLMPGTRKFVLGPYILTLEERSGRTLIVAIRHAQQEDAQAPRDVASGEDLSESDDPSN